MRFPPSSWLPRVLATAGCGVLLTFAAGCAHGTEALEEELADGESHLVVGAPEESPAARPGPLRATVVLGSGEQAWNPSRPGAPANGGPQVVVNNQVIVHSTNIVYGGWMGGTVPTEARGGAARAWAPNGWEGAGRTAAPGQTPHIGGNWAPPAEHGPATMR